MREAPQWADVEDTRLSSRRRARIEATPGDSVSSGFEFASDAPMVSDRIVMAFGYRIAGSRDTVGVVAVALFGRRPAAPRIQHGAAVDLVSVSSPLGEISATHLEIKAVGTLIVVTDLKSRNGSRLLVPGRVSRTLRGGESVVVPLGTVIDLGEGILIEVLPAPHSHPLEGTE